MEVKNYFATDTQGNVLGSAQVYLYLAGTTTLATGLQNISGAPLGNPFTSDANGLVQFKAPDNNYDLRVVKPGREFTIRIQCFDGIAFMGRVSITPTPGSIPAADDTGKISEGWLPSSVTSRQFPTLEQCGVSSENTAVQNATALRNAIVAGFRLSGSSRSYSFDFSGMSIISYTGSILQIDLGEYIHNFTNWPGIIGNDVAILEYNGRIDAGGGYCKGLGRFRRLLQAKIGTIEFRNVFCVNPAAEAQFIALEYSSNTYGDLPFCLSADIVFVKNVITQTYDRASGMAIPMTVLGNYGSTSNSVQQHQLFIGDFHVEEYYSVSQDGATPIDGDSDVLRVFTNPTQITIGSIYAKNIAKRFFKTQKPTLVSCPNVYWESDARFTQDVFIGFFEAQLSNVPVATHFEIGTCTAICADGSSRPLLFNASGLDHTIHIANLVQKNVGFYSADRDVGITIDRGAGRGLSILATACTRLELKNIRDEAIRSIRTAGGVVKDSYFAFDPDTAANTTYFIGGLIDFSNVTFDKWRVTNRVAQFRNLQDVTLNYTLGTTGYIRAFQPLTGGTRKASGVTVQDSTLVAAAIFEGPNNGAGMFVLRDFRATGGANIAAAVFSNGTWDVRLDNCAPSSVSGAGATVKTASYV